MVQYFIDGGAFMWPILFSLLFGLAFAFERAYSLVLSSIDSNYKNGDKVDSDSLYIKGIIRKKNVNIKILGDGELTKKLNFLVHSASRSAQDKIKKSGSQIDFIADITDSNDKSEEDKQPDNNS